MADFDAVPQIKTYYKHQLDVQKFWKWIKTDWKKNTFLVPIKEIHNFCAADGICAKEVVEHNNKKHKSEFENKSV